MRPVLEIADFIRSVRSRMQFGELSRAPLRLLRLELKGNSAECEWMARPPDEWDADLPPEVRERHAAAQALQDALTVRDLLFGRLPSLSHATFRVYRYAAPESTELIIAGTVTRGEEVPSTVSSVAMRAKLLGFRFWLDNGELRELQVE
jgi:hypothetical protein